MSTITSANVFATSRSIRVEDFLVKNYVSRRDAIAEALRRHGLAERFGSLMPITKAAKAAAKTITAKPVLKANVKAAELGSVVLEGCMLGHLSGHYRAVAKPATRNKGTGGGAQSIYNKPASKAGADDKNKATGTSKKAAGRRLHGFGKAQPNRADRITKHHGVGTGYNGKFHCPSYKAEGRAAAIAAGNSITFCYVESWMTQQFVETKEQRQVSRDWTTLRKAYKAERRAANRAEFYGIVTVVKQASFKSVGAAAYNHTSAKLHAAVAGEIVENKVDNGVVPASASTTSVNGVTMSDLSDIIVKAGGLHLCDIKLNNKPGTAIAAIGAAIEGDGPCSLLYPRHDLMACDNGATIKDWMTYVAVNAEGVASQQPGNLTSNQTKNAALAPFGFEAMADSGVRMPGKDQKAAKLSTGYTRTVYTPEIIKVKGMNDGYIYDSYRPAVNCHVVLDTGSRPQYKVVANPTPEEITRRALVRDFVINGATDDLDIYFDSDATFNSRMSLNAAMSANEGLLLDGKPTGRHLFIAVANATDGEYWPGVGDRADGQNRYFCNAMSFFYLPWSAAKLLYTGVCAYDKFNQQATGNFPLFPQAKHKEILSPGSISLGKGVGINARKKWMLGQDKSVNYYHAYEQASGYSNNIKEVMTQTTVKATEPAAASEAKGIYAATTATTAPAGTKYSSLKGSVAHEIKAYQTGLYNKAFGRLKELTPVEVDKIKRSSLEELAKYLGVGTATHFDQSCKPVAARLLAYFVWATNTDPDKLDVKSYKWTIEHLKDLVSIYKTGAIGITMSDNTPGKDYIQLKEVEDGHQLWMGGKPTFDFVGDIVVLHDSQQAIHHTVDLAINDGTKIDVEVASSFGCFMEIFLRVIVRLIGGNVNVYLDSSLRANVLSAVAKLPSVKLSSHRWNEQNGASEHLLRTTFQVVIKRNYKTITKAGFINTTAGAKTVSDEFKNAAQLNKRTVKGKAKELNLVAMSTEVMLELARNHALDHHFTKKTYHTGDLGHIDIDLMKQCCPVLFKRMTDWLSGHVTNIETAAGMVMVLTLKAEKGLKRMTLGKAQSATPVNPSEAGFFFYGQKRMMEGCLVSTMLAPTLVAAAGMAFWIGDQANKPAVYVPKTNKYSSGIKFIIDSVTGHPFDLTRGCQAVGDAEWTNRFDEYDQWNYLTPDRDVMIEGKKPALFSINTNDEHARVASLVVHNRNYKGKLIHIKWRAETSVDKNYSNLQIEYTLQWIESDGKLRSITKCQLAIVDESFVRNEFNPSLANVTADMVLTQDTIKADPLYSYVCLFANAVYHNIQELGVNANPTIQRLAAIKAETNEYLGLADPDKTAPLFIDNVSLIAGVYNDFLKACEEAFTHDKGIWFDWCDDLVQCRVMWEYYTNKVEMGGQGWEVVANPIAVFPELANLEAPAGSRLVVYREDGALTEKTNILALVVNKNNVCTRYMQRCAVLCGNEHVTLYNIELYESSTVKESVSNSRMLMPEIKCMDLVLKGKRCVTLQKQLLQEGKADVMRTKYLAGAACGHTFSDDLTKVEFVVDAAGNYVLASDEVKLAMVNALVDAELWTDDDLLALDNDNFPRFCEAMKDFVFVLPKYEDKGGNDYDGFYDEGGYGWDDYEGEDEATPIASKSTHYSVWMPALLSFSKLSNNSDSNQDFVSKFFKEIFKPLFLNWYVKPIDSKLCFLVMRSLLESRETIKFMGGGKNLSAKRIALGDVNLGEVHIAYDPSDKSPNTAWSLAKAAGIDVNAALKGEDIYVESTRAPLAGSYISKVVIRRTIEVLNEKGEVVGYEQEVNGKKCRYFLPTAQVGTDVALPVITDGGDFDGDLGRWCALLGLTREDLEAAALDTFDKVWDAYMGTRNTALNKPMLAGDNSSYLADHFGIKRYEGNANKTMFSGMQKAMSKAFRSAEQHALTNAAATLTQNQAVGVAYAVYILGMFLSELFKAVADTGKVDVATLSKAQQALCGENAKTLVLLVAEVYEVMLGGFSEGADAYRTKLLEKTIKGEVPTLSSEFIKDVESVLDGLGAKTDRAEEVAAVIQLVALYYSGDFDVEADANVLTSQNHWLSLAACIFEMSRGKFDGFSGVVRGSGKATHRMMLKNAIDLIKGLCALCEDDAIYDLVCDNFTIYAFRELLLTLIDELTMVEGEYLTTRWSKEHLSFFCNFGDDNDGGSDDTSEPDSDPSDGGDAVEVEAEATEVVEAESTVESSKVETKRGEVHLVKRITRQMLKNNPNALFVFGDNFERRGMGGQAKEMRGEPNAVGIATKHKPSMSPDAFLTDADFALAKEEFVNKFGYLNAELNAGKDIYFPEEGIGTGLSALADHSVCIWNYLTLCLQANLGITKFLPVSESVVEATVTKSVDVESTEPTGAVEETTESEAVTAVEEPVVTKQVERPILKEKPAAPIVTTAEETIVNPDVAVIESFLALFGDVTPSQAIESINQLSKNKVDSKSKNIEDDEVKLIVPTQEENLNKKANGTDIDFDEDELNDLNNLSDFDEGDDDDYDFDIDSDDGIPSPNDGDDSDDDGGMELSDDTESETTEPPASAVTQTAAMDIPSSVTVVETKEVEVKPAASKFTQKDIDGITELSNPLNDEQYAVLSSVLGGKNLFLTGEGGTGKSFTVSIIRAIYDYLKAPYIIVGSTGTSVVNIDGHATFNAMFGLGIGFPKVYVDKKLQPRTLQQWEQLRNAVIKAPRLTNKLVDVKKLTNHCGLPLLVIVDEVSMLESALLSAVEAGLRKLNVKHNWLLVGDASQFEPIEGKKFFCDDSLYCNRTKQRVVVKSIYNDPELDFSGYNLKTNVRAKGDAAWSKAMSWVRLRIGDDFTKVVKERWEHSVNNPAPKNALHLAYTNKIVKQFNDEATAKLLASGAYSKVYPGTFITHKKEEKKQDDYWLYKNPEDRKEGITQFAPISFHMTYCIGMRVMLRETNIYDDKNKNILINNGAQGTVVDLMPTCVVVQFDNGIKRVIKAIDMKDESERGTFTQIPLAPAYALTFTKAQGMTFDNDVIFHMYMNTQGDTICEIKANHAVYVALSRLTNSKHCWFVTDVVGSKGEEAYTLFKKSLKASQEAIDFNWNLK